jgi:Flp pilus assembly protein TadD
MELQNERLFDVRERAARKWLLILLLVVAALGFPAVWFGPRLYSQFQQVRLLRQARELLQTGDATRAVICLRRVLDLNRHHLEATRTLADLADAFVPEEAPALRERVAQLAPASYPDAVAWAHTALRAGQAAEADDAFELMKKLGPPDAALHELGARVALASGRQAEARAEFARALALDPARPDLRLELAALDLLAPDPAVQEPARQTLERLRADPPLQHAALRALIGDLARREKIPEALALAAAFIADPAATFQDRLLYLGLLSAAEAPSFALASPFQESRGLALGMVRAAPPATFTSYLTDLQELARDHPQHVAELIAFLTARGRALLALEWAGTLPRPMVSSLPVAPALAGACEAARHWPRLEALLAGAHWGRAESLRCAYAARLLHEKGDRAAAAVQWNTAVNLAEYRAEKLTALGRLAYAWGWMSEWEELLWTAADHSKHPREALEALADLYRSGRGTEKLFAIWSRLRELDPADFTARKNWVRLALLMNRDRYATGALAEELYRQHPEDPEVATSYAYVLHLRLRDAEALATLQRLPPEQLRTPTIAGYYGILLLANRKKPEAAAALALATDAALLREEKELVDKARHALD